MAFEKNKNGLEANFEFEDFIEAFSFITKVAILAEKHNHHPEMRNTYNKVFLRLTTHDAGNTVTDRDQKLADAIEAIL
jgi:4a-hydroxytetrahydrobiopterin dehydratase